VFFKLLPPNPFIATEVITDGQLFPNKFSSKCPAILFAVKCTASVTGRIRFLIISMITINDINIVGVPWGTKCLDICLVRIFNLPE
jgi:hypothetical protein